MRCRGMEGADWLLLVATVIVGIVGTVVLGSLIWRARHGVAPCPDVAFRGEGTP